MTVTAVQKEKKHLCRVLLDGGDEHFIDSDICSLYGLSAGSELDTEGLERIIYESEYARAKSRCLWYLDRSDHTKKGMQDKLCKAGFDKKASQDVVERMADIGLIDDRRYAERYAAMCVEHNVSRREAVFKLISKGIPRDIANEVIDELKPDEEKQIRILLEKKYSSKLSDRDQTQKVYAALIRKGFSFGAVKNVLKAYCEELEYSEE